VSEREADAIRAVEVIRRWESRPAGVCPSEDFIAAVQLARAWLAEHRADDGEPVTTDWLSSAGFVEEMGSYSVPVGFDAAELYAHFGVTRRPAWWLANRNGDKIFLRPPTTRGQVRALCAALGIGPRA
jgi:hypothetical protein